MRVLPSLIASLLLAASGQTARAAEWKIDPTLRFNTRYDDNVRLSIANEVSSASATFSPSVVFSVTTPESGASGTLGFDFRRFEADSDLNDDNSRLTANLFHTLQRASLGLNLAFINDTTLDSQLDTTGVVFNRRRRQFIKASPNLNYAFDVRTNVSLNYTYSNTRFNNADGITLVDSSTNAAQVSLNRVLNNRSTASITLSGSKTNSDNNVDSTTINLQSGASYQLNETWSTSLFFGARRSEINSSRNSSIDILSGGTKIGEFALTRDVTSNTNGLTFNASVSKTFLRGNITLLATRSVSNDINGQPIETTSLRQTMLYRFSETLSGNLELAYTTTKADSDFVGNLDQTSYQVAPAVTWNLSNFWRLTGSYHYRKQTFDHASGDATQNVFDLVLAYQWPRISVSR